MMKIRKLVVLSGVCIMILAGCAQTKEQLSSLDVRPGSLQYLGPAVSVPPVHVAPNGDIEGHYPPYYYPSGGAGAK